MQTITNGLQNIGTVLTAEAQQLSNQLVVATPQKTIQPTQASTTPIVIATDVFNIASSLAGVVAPIAGPQVAVAGGVFKTIATLLGVSKAASTATGATPPTTADQIQTAVSKLEDVWTRNEITGETGAQAFAEDMTNATGTFFNSVYSGLVQAANHRSPHCQFRFRRLVYPRCRKRHKRVHTDLPPERA